MNKVNFPPISRSLAITLAVLWIFIISIGVSIFMYSHSVFAKRDEADKLQTTVADLETQEKILHKNNSLSENDVDTFNKVSSELVPSEESYFSLISAIEEISTKSGFELSDYNIDIQKDDKNKVSISVKGDGNIENFLKFLEVYNFSGGRLVTVEEFNVPLEEGESYDIVLNFYHNRGQKSDDTQASAGTFIPEVQAAPAITDKDLQFIKTVLDQTR